MRLRLADEKGKEAHLESGEAGQWESCIDRRSPRLCGDVNDQ
jgi:hypothetical protein